MRIHHVRIAVLASLLCWGTANATLVSRSGGQAYYDTDTNLTWVADANLAKTSSYDADGLMTWTAAQGWIASLNAQNAGLGYLGTNTWRLPTVTDTGAPGCNFAYSGTDCGYNVDLATGEMAHLYYSTLGNLAYCDTGGSCPQGLWGPTNIGPLSDVQLEPADYYWSGVDSGVDSDVDGIADGLDNCTSGANNLPGAVPGTGPPVRKSQLDSDHDGFGNRCDGDLNNSGGNVNTTDYSILRSVINKAYTFSTNAANSDLNGDGTVNTTDYSIFRTLINKPPGPSGTTDEGLFDLRNGYQDAGGQVNSHYAWAVRTGDIAAVPVPVAAWFFGSALGLMGVMRRKITSC